MPNNLRYYYKLLKFRFLAPHQKGFGIHSPSLFEFITKIVFDTEFHEEYLRIEGLYPARIKQLKKKYGRLICRIACNYKPQTILEITTIPSLISLYLTAGNNTAEYLCINECNQQSKRINHLADLVSSNWKDLNGNIDKILPGIINSKESFDIIYLNYFTDFNSAYTYFESLLPCIKPSTIVIVGFIHQSSAAEIFWNKLIANQQVRQSIDLFNIGILFFNEGLQKENFIVKF